MIMRKTAPTLSDQPRDATRGGVNGPALPVQRGRESPLWINQDVDLVGKRAKA